MAGFTPLLPLATENQKGSDNRDPALRREHMSNTPLEGVTGYADGRDPEEFGWVFAESGCSTDCYTLLYETHDRETAEDHGVPTSLLDQYEASGCNSDDYGSGLSNWLQEKTS